MIFNCVVGGICLLIGGLIPTPSGDPESLVSERAGFSACCSQFDRFSARPQNFSLAQGKAQRRQTDLAAATSSDWSSLVQFKSGLAREAGPAATYSSIQTSHPSDRAPPFTT